MHSARTVIATALGVFGGILAFLAGALQFIFGDGFYIRTVLPGEQGLIMMLGGILGIGGGISAWRRPESWKPALLLGVAGFMAMEFWVTPPVPALALGVAAIVAYLESR